MAISTLLPAGGANDNRPNLKQFFGKNPAVANDNVERVSSGMFTDTFADSVVTTLHSLIEEIAKISDIAKSVIASFGAIVKSLKSLNKDVTSRFRVLNNELNASKIDFIRTVLAVPKTEALPKIEGVPVNVTAPEAPKAEDKDKGFDIGDLLAGYLGLKGGGAIIKSSLGGLLTFFMSPAGIALMTFGGAFFLLYKGLDDLTKAIMNDPMFAALKKRSEGKTDLQEVSEAGKQVGEKLKGRPELQKGFKSREEAFYKEPGNSWGDGGSKLKVSDFKRFPKNENGEEVGILNNKLKDGTVAINIQTGQKYGEIDENASVQGSVKVGAPIGAPSTPAAPAGSPMPAGGPQTSSPAALGATAAGGFGISGVTGTSGAGAPSAAPAAPAGAPAGEVKPESNMQAPPPSGRPSLKGAIASAIPVPPAGPSGTSGAGGAGGVAVVKNSSVQNVGSTGGAETGGMTGQNLPMFARNDKLQGLWGRQVLQQHQ